VPQQVCGVAVRWLMTVEYILKGQMLDVRFRVNAGQEVALEHLEMEYMVVEE